jgi:hypothetical protein
MGEIYNELGARRITEGKHFLHWTFAEACEDKEFCVKAARFVRGSEEHVALGTYAKARLMLTDPEALLRKPVKTSKSQSVASHHGLLIQPQPGAGTGLLDEPDQQLQMLPWLGFVPPDAPGMPQEGLVPQRPLRIAAGRRALGSLWMRAAFLDLPWPWIAQVSRRLGRLLAWWFFLLSLALIVRLVWVHVLAALCVATIEIAMRIFLDALSQLGVQWWGAVDLLAKSLQQWTVDTLFWWKLHQATLGSEETVPHNPSPAPPVPLPPNPSHCPPQVDQYWTGFAAGFQVVLMFLGARHLRSTR